MSQILDHVKTEPLLVMGILPRITVPRSIAFACAAALLLAGSGITSVIPVQAEDVLIAGNHGNNSNKDKSKSKGNKNNANNCDKSNDKSKCNNGVRDHGIGYGKDEAGQGKGQGHKNKK